MILFITFVILTVGIGQDLQRSEYKEFKKNQAQIEKQIKKISIMR